MVSLSSFSLTFKTFVIFYILTLLEMYLFIDFFNILFVLQHVI